METNETAVCHSCNRDLPLHENYFYKSKGKWWIYRCKECSTERNKKYYKEVIAPNSPNGTHRRGPLGGPKPRMARDVGLKDLTQEDIAAAVKLIQERDRRKT